MKIIVIGLSITSSWGNGHATTYRALLRELQALGHEVLFLERDVPYYATNRDMPRPDFCSLGLYQDPWELMDTYGGEVADADVVIMGSYVQQGVDIGRWVVSKAHGTKVFYDLDTPVTLSKLDRGDHEYLHPSLIDKFDLYLSFSGGAVLEYLEKHYKAPRARALYCSVDPERYAPRPVERKWQMGYMGTYSADRQVGLHQLLNKPAAFYPQGNFIVVGPQYPKKFTWASNVERMDHLSPEGHREFYNAQKFTLNVTREAMKRMGHSPSVRLFEAAACGVPIISDPWTGLDSIFEIGTEILVAGKSSEVLEHFETIGDDRAREIGMAAREKVLEFHTAKVRAKELENYITEIHEPSKY